MESNDIKQDILKRLSKIEGQARGIRRMVDEEKYCADILIQIAAIRAAINKVGGMILENHSRQCMKEAINSDQREETIDEMIDVILRFMK